MTRFKLQSSVNLSGHSSYRRFSTSVTVVKERTYISTRTALALEARHALHLATPTIILNFREENILDPKSNHEIHEILELYGIQGYWCGHQSDSVVTHVEKSVEDTF